MHICKKNTTFAAGFEKMTNTHLLYRIGAWIKHQFSAWNSGGEGIHSPYLFYIVRLVIDDDNRYYCWDDIEERRDAMLRATKQIEVTDFGSRGGTYTTSVKKVAKNSLSSPRNAQIFFRIANWLGHDAERSIDIIELGTNLGITTAYLASAAKTNRITSFEGSEELIQLARRNWRKLGLRNIRVFHGNIDQTLFKHAKKPFDLAFIDANHRYEPTCRYVDHLAQFAHEKSIIIIDDIHYSPEMEQAWKTIQQRDYVTTTMDYFDFGLIFFDTHYLKKHYRLRI